MNLGSCECNFCHCQWLHSAVNVDVSVAPVSWGHRFMHRFKFRFILPWMTKLLKFIYLCLHCYLRITGGNDIWNESYIELGIWNQVKLWSSQLWMNAILTKIQGFSVVCTCDLALPVRHSNLLSYESTDGGNRPFVGSNGQLWKF